MLLKQTKIVASISDRRCDVDFIKQLFEAGISHLVLSATGEISYSVWLFP
jgi:pyruvate kinase